MTTEPAAAVVGELLDFVDEGLRFHGDRDHIRRLVGSILSEGNGASRQRRASAESDVMKHVLDETMRPPS